MKTFTLIRYAYTNNGTFGTLIHGEEVVCATLELPYKDNRRNISCIPIGAYTMNRCRVSPQYGRDSSRFGDTFCIESVPNRSKILIHAGNTTKDTRGCILVGERARADRVINSRLALNRLLYDLRNHDTASLIIRDQAIYTQQRRIP